MYLATTFGPGAPTYSPVPWLSPARRPPSMPPPSRSPRCVRSPHPPPAGGRPFRKDEENAGSGHDPQTCPAVETQPLPQSIVAAGHLGKSESNERTGIFFGLVSIWPLVVRLHFGV